MEHMVDVIGHIKEAPELAKFQWRATNRWVNGAHSQTTIETYSGAGGEQSHRKPFVYDADHPELFQASDEGVTPPEFLLHALAGCLTAGIASVAASRGVQLDEVSSTIEAGQDLRGTLGIKGGDRVGYDRIAVSFSVEADASPEDIASIVERSTSVSPVFDVLTNGTTVDVTVG